MNQPPPEPIDNYPPPPVQPPVRDGFPFWLPWTLAAGLGLACIVLMTQLQTLENENHTLRKQLDNLKQPTKA